MTSIGEPVVFQASYPSGEGDPDGDTGLPTGSPVEDYPSDFLETWAGCSHLDCLPECWISLEGGHCERLAQAWREWQRRTDYDPKRDAWESAAEAYRVIRARMAAGGQGWEPKGLRDV